jgi:hypothetical protein
MPPEPDIGFRIIGRKSGFSRVGIHLPENSVDFVIGEHTEIAVDDPIEFGLGMESESESVMDPLLFGDVLSPREFYLISVSVDFRRWNDGMEYRCSFRCFVPIFLNIMKCLTDLFRFDLQLFLIGDGKPFTSSVYLKVDRKFLFERGFFYRFHDLRFEVARSGLEDPEVHDASGDSTSGDNDLPSVWSERQAFPSEYEFIDTDIFEDIIFFHGYRGGL